MKRSLLLLAFLLVAVLAITACNRNGNDDPPAANDPPTQAETPDPTPQDDPAEPEVPAELTTVSWIIIDGGRPAHDAVVEEVNRLLIERHPEMGLQLDLIMLDWGEYSDRINMMLLGGEVFDIAYFAQWMSPFFAPVAARGDLTALNDLLPVYAPNIMNMIPDERWFNALSHGGNIYGIPMVYQLLQSPGLTFHAYYVDKHGFDYQSVRTLADVEPFLEIIAEHEPHLIPFLPGTGSSHLNPPHLIDSPLEDVDWWFQFNPTTGEFFDGFEDETRIMPYWRLMHDWFNRGFIAPDAASRTIWGDEIRTTQYAVMPNFAFVNDGITNSELYGFRVYDVRLFTNSPLRTADVQNTILGISRTSQHPHRALQMIDTVWSDPLITNTLNYGIQGIHWNFTNEAAMMIEVTDAGQEEWFNGGISYQIAGLYHKFGTPERPREGFEASMYANRAGTPSALLGFSADFSEVETEAAAFFAITGEVEHLLNTGTVNPDTFVQDVISRLEAAGRETLRADLEAQLTAWQAANPR